MSKFSDRYAAGKILADQLQSYANKPNVIILALPRGGVPVAYEIAKKLKVPLDIFMVRKLGVPGHEELAMGAMAMDGSKVFNNEILRQFNISEVDIERVMQAEKIELQRRESVYRGNKPFPELKDKIIILVDDGIATGATMKAAITALRQYHPARIVLAVPVAALDTCKNISHLVDEIFCPLKPHDLYAVGAWYENFLQTTDEEVHELLKVLESW